MKHLSLKLLSEIVVSRRKVLKLSQTALSQKANINRSILSRLEAQDYSPELTAQVTKAYRESLDKLSQGQEHFGEDVLEKLQQNSPREFGLGTYRFRQSRDSI